MADEPTTNASLRTPVGGKPAGTVEFSGSGPLLTVEAELTLRPPGEVRLRILEPSGCDVPDATDTIERPEPGPELATAPLPADEPGTRAPETGPGASPSPTGGTTNAGGSSPDGRGPWAGPEATTPNAGVSPVFESAPPPPAPEFEVLLARTRHGYEGTLPLTSGNAASLAGKTVVVETAAGDVWSCGTIRG